MVYLRFNRAPCLILTLILLSKAVFGTNLDKANQFYNQQKYKEAIPLYKKAAGEGENPAICYFNLANAYFQLDSLPQSIIYYKSMLTLAPDFFRGHLNLAIAYYTLEDFGECIAALNRALQITPDHEKALLVLAACYLRLKAYPEGVTTFEKITALNPQNEDAYLSIAEIYRELNDVDEAIKWLSICPDWGNKEQKVNLFLAELYESKGDLDKALYYLKLSFEKESSNNWMMYRIVLLLEKSGNDMVALEEAKRGLQLFPEFAELALLAGNLSFRQQLYDQAAVYYTLARDRGNPGAVTGLENIRLIKNREKISK